MKQQIIQLTENELKEVIKEATQTVIQTMTEPTHDEYHDDSLVEMARLNKNETGHSIFPFNVWEVKIWSNDHNPPHFHILCNGWNVSFVIETQEILNIEAEGKHKQIFDYMVKNVGKWLDSPCAAQPKISNRENAILMWEMIHN